MADTRPKRGADTRDVGLIKIMAPAPPERAAARDGL